MTSQPLPATSGLSRRSMLAAAGVAALPWPLAAQAQDDGPIRLGQSTTLTGPLGEVGQATHQGAKLAFAAINARGGVLGRPIELETRDDGYDAKRALANVTDFLADRKTFALFNCFGTSAVETMLPLVIDSGVPFFAPFTGAEFPQAKAARNVFTVRASYADEAAKIVQHVTSIGLKRIAIAYQNTPFGEQVLAAAQAALKAQSITPVATVTVEHNGTDAVRAATRLADSEAQMVLLGLAGKSAIDFTKAIRSRNRGMSLAGLSVMSTPEMLKTLGPDGVGISFSQVVPTVHNRSVPVVREFLQAWKASDANTEPSHQALEGYINARVFAETLTRAGRNPTRAAFIDAAWKMRRYDLGGFEVGFTQPGRSASRFIELVMSDKEGRLMR